MDIARPEFKQQKRRRQIIWGIVGLVCLGGVTVGVSRLKPASPEVERGTVWSLNRLPMTSSLKPWFLISATMPTANAIRAAIRTMDNDLPVYKIQTMEHIVAESISETRFTMELLSLFGALALILAAIGVYGVMSYSVAQRIHEMGIRKALGATPQNIAALFVKQGSMLALVGVAIGLVGAFALTRLMSKLLYGISTADPKTLIGMSLLLIAATLFPCYLAGRKATKVDPMVALRYE